MQHSKDVKRKYLFKGLFLKVAFVRLRPLWYKGSMYMKRDIKRDPHIWKETYIYKKRLYWLRPSWYKGSMYMKRHIKRDPHIWKEMSKETKRDLHIWKESLSIETLMIHGIYVHWLRCQKRPTYLKWDLHI